MSEYIKISFKDAKKILDEDPNAVILDVREEDEYLTGHAVNALLFPVDEINEYSAAEILPDKSVPVLVYCKSGIRSKTAAEILSAAGYEKVYDIGSLVGWPYGLED